MTDSFEFEEKNGGACVTKLLTPGAVCVVPETLGGLPVTELADKVFARSQVEEVYLPKYLKRIGRYEFYGCEKLHSIHFYGALHDVGGGVFTDCRNIDSLTVHMGPEEESALKDFITEINGRVTVHLFVGREDGEDLSTETEKVRLIFPEYFDEAVENTPARMTVSNIHGTGQKYRYCFEGRKLRLDRYDKLFPYEKIEEATGMAAGIAIERLARPHGLWESARKEYEDFIKDHIYEILLDCMKEPETEKWLIGHFLTPESALLTEEECKNLIEHASGQKYSELCGIFMDFRKKAFGVKKRKFEL